MSLRQAAKPVAIANESVRNLTPRVINYRKRKRILDILGSSILLILLFPIIFVFSVLVKLTSRGPILFKAPRVGLCGKTFLFYKFRSMKVGSDEKKDDLKEQNEREGPIFKMKNDPRVTSVGRFMRKYSIDELPQLLNVFKGDMSLVGPRPPLPREVELYDEYMAERLSVRPGLTCYWQIMGRSDLTFEQWMELDHKYLQEMSLWVDLKILVKTPLAVLRGDGAY
ncbi:MAG: sugar transferase [Chthonomonadaceae bacterium]|jgi:lipopolysaccharide/colanic/teichoic acid biosynthesis glycosyltransferase|nr:sugar transferase [Chthonomonadaceae bacterium]